MTRGISGRSSRDSFAYFDPDSSSLKTCQGTLDSDSTECSPTLPKRGSMQNGWLYERPTWAPPTDASACSSLLPTPNATVAQDGEGPETWLARREVVKAKGINGNGMGMPLTIAVQLLPTPSASDHTGGEGATRQARQESGATGGPSLRDLCHLLPTTTTKPGILGRETNLLPTPQSADAVGSRFEKSAMENGRRRPSGAHATLPLPTAVRLLPGAPTSPPSAGGSTSSDAQPPRQLTLKDA